MTLSVYFHKSQRPGYKYYLNGIIYIPVCTIYYKCRYGGKITRLEAEHCLEGLKDGTYLVRKSESRTDYTHAIAIKLVQYYTKYV